MYHPTRHAMPAFNYAQILDKTALALHKCLPYMCSGASRAVYELNKECVLKVPNRRDYMANILEYSIWLDFKFGYSKIPIAPCELVYTADNVPCIVMARVTIKAEHCVNYTFPKWAQDLADGQVGKLESGSLVCYDAGYGTEDYIYCEDHKLEYVRRGRDAMYDYAAELY